MYTIVWNGARDTICEANTFLNCDRAIALGLVQRARYLDHKGGIVRNNFIYATKREVPHLDSGITIQSPGAKVLHNTILHDGGYPDAIETRWPTTTNVEVINNLTDGKVTARDGASMKIANNPTASESPAVIAAEAHRSTNAKSTKVKPSSDRPANSRSIGSWKW